MSYLDKDGYVVLSTVNGLREMGHVSVAEKALGRKLPDGAVVHHVNEDRKDNRNSNLVICPSRAYHNLLHARMRAQAASGNANWRKCCRCLEYDAPENLSFSGQQAYHKKCNYEHVVRIMGRAA